MVLVVLVDLVDLVDLKDPVNGFIRNRQSLTGSTRAKQCQPGPTNKFRNRSSKKQEAALGTKKIKCHCSNTAPVFFLSSGCLDGCEQIKKTQDEPQWIVAQRLLSALTIPFPFPSPFFPFSFHPCLPFPFPFSLVFFGASH